MYEDIAAAWQTVSVRWDERRLLQISRTHSDNHVHGLAFFQYQQQFLPNQQAKSAPASLSNPKGNISDLLPVSEDDYYGTQREKGRTSRTVSPPQLPSRNSETNHYLSLMSSWLSNKSYFVDSKRDRSPSQSDLQANENMRVKLLQTHESADEENEDT